MSAILWISAREYRLQRAPAAMEYATLYALNKKQDEAKENTALMVQLAGDGQVQELRKARYKQQRIEARIAELKHRLESLLA